MNDKDEVLSELNSDDSDEALDFVSAELSDGTDKDV